MRWCLTFICLINWILSVDRAAAADSVDFFPLDVGDSWTYRENGFFNETRTVQPGTFPIGGAQTRVVEITSGVDSGTQFFLTNDGFGLRQHREVIPGPDGGQVDYTIPLDALPPTFFVTNTVLQSAAPTTVFVTGSGSFAGTYTNQLTIVSMESVTVPAGTFDTFRVQQSFTLNIPGFEPLVSNGSDWYARNIGIVRSEGVTDGQAVLSELTSHNLVLCGDFNDDGVIDSTDTLLYRRALAGLQVLNPGAESRCTTTAGPSSCDVLDVVVLRREEEGPLLSPGIGTTCNDP